MLYDVSKAKPFIWCDFSTNPNTADLHVDAVFGVRVLQRLLKRAFRMDVHAQVSLPVSTPPMFEYWANAPRVPDAPVSRSTVINTLIVQVLPLQMPNAFPADLLAQHNANAAKVSHQAYDLLMDGQGNLNPVFCSLKGGGAPLPRWRVGGHHVIRRMSHLMPEGASVEVQPPNSLVWYLDRFRMLELLVSLGGLTDLNAVSDSYRYFQYDSGSMDTAPFRKERRGPASNILLEAFVLKSMPLNYFKRK